MKEARGENMQIPNAADPTNQPNKKTRQEARGKRKDREQNATSTVGCPLPLITGDG